MMSIAPIMWKWEGGERLGSPIEKSIPMNLQLGTC